MLASLSRPTCPFCGSARPIAPDSGGARQRKNQVQRQEPQFTRAAKQAPHHRILSGNEHIHGENTAHAGTGCHMRQKYRAAAGTRLNEGTSLIKASSSGSSMPYITRAQEATTIQSIPITTLKVEFRLIYAVTSPWDSRWDSCYPFRILFRITMFINIPLCRNRCTESEARRRMYHAPGKFRERR